MYIYTDIWDILLRITNNNSGQLNILKVKMAAYLNQVIITPFLSHYVNKALTNCLHGTFVTLHERFCRKRIQLMYRLLCKYSS